MKYNFNCYGIFVKDELAETFDTWDEAIQSLHLYKKRYFFVSLCRGIKFPIEQGKPWRYPYFPRVKEAICYSKEGTAL